MATGEGERDGGGDRRRVGGWLRAEATDSKREGGSSSVAKNVILPFCPCFKISKPNSAISLLFSPRCAASSRSHSLRRLQIRSLRRPATGPPPAPSALTGSLRSRRLPPLPPFLAQDRRRLLAVGFLRSRRRLPQISALLSASAKIGQSAWGCPGCPIVTRSEIEVRMDSHDCHSWIELGSNLYAEKNSSKESNVTTLRKEPSAHDDPNEEEICDSREEENTEINVDWSSLQIENEDGYGFGLLDEDAVFMTMGFGVDDDNTEPVANNPPDVPVIPNDVEDDIADACMVVNDGGPC
ncbi:hypothetical protein GUJ93_ZPchr0013g36824 [Zizania palustris]|uniref:Uncharacterized protein n=1 Tax=Zizania palustris TaxID=103762 RepID=A0A8J5WZU7_ZIZPA|nr:hypothetical protein GUJ93_ZPchr0013g36824 [Zizania palustris]